MDGPFVLLVDGAGRERKRVETSCREPGTAWRFGSAVIDHSDTIVLSCAHS